MVFPVKTPYVVGPDLIKLSGPVFEATVSPHYQQEKRIELERLGSSLFGTVPEAREGILAFSRFCGFRPTEDICEIALQLNEDIAVLRNGVLLSICFCFPSSFVPAALVNRSFLQIHEPVPENETLNKATPNIVRHLGTEGNNFRRTVWSLSTHPGLSQHPSYPRPTATKLEDLYFRTETQTTVGRGDGWCFFFTRVEMTPLMEIWGDEEKRTAIISSVNSMSEAVLEYKGLREIREVINRISF